MPDQFYWYTTRSAGILAWVLAMGSIVLGLLLASRVMGKKPGFPWLLDLHRFVSGLSVFFLGLHMVTLWADDFTHFAWAELFIPGRSETQTTAVTWGVIAAWVLALVQLSSLVKAWLPKRLWHGMHLGSYVVAVTGTVHAVMAGSDIERPLVLLLGVFWIGTVTVLSTIRIRALLRPRSGTPPVSTVRPERGLTVEQRRTPGRTKV